MKKYVYMFKEGNKDMRDILGGKGANLSEMINLGLPVPNGFTISTEACLSYYNNKKKIDGKIVNEILKKLSRLEKETGKKINNYKRPLLISIRSGSKVSMPGMMDTILNVGLNDKLAKEMTEKGGYDKKFVYDSYRRLIMMYADVVHKVDKDNFMKYLDNYKKAHGYINDFDLNGDDFYFIASEFKKIFKEKTGREFPSDISIQLLNSTCAVFDSWENERAKYYRKINNISDTLYTAVNVQEMVYGNLNDNSLTGVSFTRNPENGENEIYGEFMINAQGEDLVSGVRTPLDINEMKNNFYNEYYELCKISKKLEKHYKDMQDMEFTVENNKLYILQTRNGKRSAKSALEIALSLYKEKIINKEELITRVSIDDIENLLHKRLDPKTVSKDNIIGEGIAASLGAGVGKICFDKDKVIENKKNNIESILVREETSADDIMGMAESAAVVTLSGGRTSHAAVVARGMGIPCVCGASSLKFDSKNKVLYSGKTKLKEGDIISVDASNGIIYKGECKLISSDVDENLIKYTNIVSTNNTLKVRANAESINDVVSAIKFGADGIGLSRTEHMFFKENKLLELRNLIFEEDEKKREKILKKLKKFQMDDFEKIFKLINGLPITVRYLDPPLHEFIPKTKEDIKSYASLSGADIKTINKKKEELKEVNPMMGLRGSRLLVKYPDIIKMQTEGIISAAIKCEMNGIKTDLELMIPLTISVEEFIYLKKIINDTAKELFKKYNYVVKYKVGTMIETPRSALIADKIAKHADFFSIGSNDLTQLTFAFSRDDSYKYINEYLEKDLLSSNPFDKLDVDGVGSLIEIAINKARSVKPNIKIGICGEHGGNYESIKFFKENNFNYVSVSPYRIPASKLVSSKLNYEEKKGN